uniref:Uncharacterized protein n=1 Tax=Ditylenchus dipsaci TaxID=166011 RepID=A0A915D151_9BILA
MKNDTGVEGLQAKQEPIEKPKLEYGQQKPNQDPKIEDIQLATAADELKPEQVQNTEEHVNVGENAAESNLQNVTKQKEDKKEITGQTDAIGTIGDPK